MTTNDPVHPGVIVHKDCRQPPGLSISGGAPRLCFGSLTIASLVNEKAFVSISMAWRLSKGVGSSPETWPDMQMMDDLAKSRHLDQTPGIDRIAPMQATARYCATMPFGQKTAQLPSVGKLTGPRSAC